MQACLSGGCDGEGGGEGCVKGGRCGGVSSGNCGEGGDVEGVSGGEGDGRGCGGSGVGSGVGVGSRSGVGDGVRSRRGGVGRGGGDGGGVCLVGLETLLSLVEMAVVSQTDQGGLPQHSSPSASLVVTPSMAHSVVLTQTFVKVD